MTDVQRVDLLDPAEVARLGGIEIVAQGVVEGFLAGIHRSPFRGFSVEFTEHRAYQPGDEPRYLDWKMLARSDRLFVKQFEEETNLRAMILVDASRSMAWRGARARGPGLRPAVRPRPRAHGAALPAPPRPSGDRRASDGSGGGRALGTPRGAVPRSRVGGQRGGAAARAGPRVRRDGAARDRG